jgi:hypothetical protein
MCAFETRAGRGIPSFALWLALGLTFAMRASAVTRQIPDQQNGTTAPSSGKNVTAQTAPAVEVINGNSRAITDFNANSNTARPAAGVRRHTKAASAGTSVEVINGSMERTVVLKAEPLSTSVRNTTHGNAARHPARKRSAAAHRRSRADKISPNHKNGTLIETPMAVAKEQLTERRNLPPNVIGIASSDSRSQQGKSKPVVVGIQSGESEHGASNAQPVVVGIASSASQSSGSNARPVVIGISASGAQAAGTVKPVAVGVVPRPAKRRPYRPAALDAQ